MVTDPSRWSRDNAKNKSGLGVLRDHGIRFFTLGTEHDLFDPQANLLLGMAAEFNEYQAIVQTQKSILNRVNRAKRGVPTAGSLPFGRTYDRASGTWGIDPEKKAMMEDVARRYIAGEPLAKIAEEYGVDHSGLHVNLTQRCGPLWEQAFNVPRLNIRDTVVTEVPALLPEKTIQEIQERVKANNTFAHGAIKNRYLLSRMILCGHCGSALSGHAQDGRLYYQHFWKAGKCLQGWVRADEIEAAVIRELFDCFGNPAAVQRAIEQATPDAEKLEEARNRLQRIAVELNKVDAGRDRILRLVAKGTVTDRQAEKQLWELNQKETRLREEGDRLSQHVSHVPNATEIKDVAKRVAAAFGQRVNGKKRVAIRQANADLANMTWEDKRALLEAVFSGKTPDGHRMGVYVERIDGQAAYGHKHWKYTLRGHLIDETGITMSPEQVAAVYGEPDGAATKQRELATKLGRWYRDQSQPVLATPARFRTRSRPPYATPP